MAVVVCSLFLRNHSYALIFPFDTYCDASINKLMNSAEEKTIQMWNDWLELGIKSIFLLGHMTYSNGNEFLCADSVCAHKIPAIWNGTNRRKRMPSALTNVQIIYFYFKRLSSVERIAIVHLCTRPSCDREPLTEPLSVSRFDAVFIRSNCTVWHNGGTKRVVFIGPATE